MSDVRLTRGERRKQRTETSILDAAEDCFTKHGFHGVTVEEIAEAADVAVGSIYVHFKSKEGLYLALIERAFEIEESYMTDVLDDALAPTEQLLAAGDAYLRFYLDHPGYFRMLVFPHLDARPPDDDLPDAARHLAARAEEQVGRIAAVIERGIATGVARAVDPYRAAKFLWGAWNGVIALNLRPDRLKLPDDELAAVLEEGRRMIVEGLALAPAGSTS